MGGLVGEIGLCLDFLCLVLFSGVGDVVEFCFGVVICDKLVVVS